MIVLNFLESSLFLQYNTFVLSIYPSSFLIPAQTILTNSFNFPF